MKKWLNPANSKTKHFLFVGILILVFGVFFVSLKLADSKDPVEGVKDPVVTPEPDEKEPTPVDKPIEKTESFVLPCTISDYKLVRKFYRYDAETSEQELAVIQFGSQYFLSKGISIARNDNEGFNIVATLSGTVKEVTDSPVYGKTVTIDHGNGIVSEYISLSEVSVKNGDVISQGDIIGVSGVNEYDQASNNHVHFKVSVNGVLKDPEQLIGVKKNEIK